MVYIDKLTLIWEKVETDKKTETYGTNRRKTDILKILGQQSAFIGTIQYVRNAKKTPFSTQPPYVTLRNDKSIFAPPTRSVR